MRIITCMEETLKTIAELYEDFAAESVKDTKTAARKARKLSMELRNALKEFKAQSLAADKA